MSTDFSVYIGPFAEWLVPKAKHNKVSEMAQALMDQFQLSDEGGLDFGSNWAEVVISRKRFIREWWTASFEFASHTFAPPPRRFTWSGDSAEIGVWEYAGFDIEQEKRWFQQKFAQQLKELVEVYGVDPTIKWGVVTRL